MQNPNVYFANGLKLCADRSSNSLQFRFNTGLGIVLEFNNRDAKVESCGAYVIRLIVPSPFINIEFEDWGDHSRWVSVSVTTLENHLMYAWTWLTEPHCQVSSSFKYQVKLKFRIERIRYCFRDCRQGLDNFKIYRKKRRCSLQLLVSIHLLQLHLWIQEGFHFLGQSTLCLDEFLWWLHSVLL